MFADHTIDLDRIGRLVVEEVAWLRAHPDEPELGAEEALRSWFVAWWAVLAPEIVPPAAATALAAVRDNWDLRDEYDPQRWLHRIVPAAALFALSGHAADVATLRANLDHHDVRLRSLALAAGALLGPRLAVSDAEVTRRLRHNLGQLQSVAESLGLLLLVRGTADEKAALLRACLFGHELRGSASDAVRSLLARGAMPNPFAERFRELERYVLVRLLAEPGGAAPGAMDVSASQAIIDTGERASDMPTIAPADAAPPAPWPEDSDMPPLPRIWNRLRTYPALQAELRLE